MKPTMLANEKSGVVAKAQKTATKMLLNMHLAERRKRMNLTQGDIDASLGIIPTGLITGSLYKLSSVLFKKTYIRPFTLLQLPYVKVCSPSNSNVMLSLIFKFSLHPVSSPLYQALIVILKTMRKMPRFILICHRRTICKSKLNNL